MAWENTNGNTKVVAESNGEERSFNFEGSMKLKDAVREVSRSMSYGSVLVTADGRNVEPNEGEKPISDFSLVKIVPKMAGASEEEDGEIAVPLVK